MSEVDKEQDEYSEIENYLAFEDQEDVQELVGEEGEGKDGEKGEKKEDYGNLNLMNEEELRSYANELSTTIRYLELESQILVEFLKQYNPTALEGIEDVINEACALALKRNPLDSHKSSLNESETSNASLTKEKKDSQMSIINIIEGRGPKINISTKTDMIVRTIEQAQVAHDNFVKKAIRTKRNLKSDLEEFATRETDLKYAKSQFEFDVIIAGVEKITNRIPAETWKRYMDEWFKYSMLTMEKLRLRCASLKTQYNKQTKIFIRRKELAANVHAVDFDQLEISNKHLLEKIDKKQAYLVELKKKNGGANLILSRHKKYLIQQHIDYNKFIQDIADKEEQIHELEEEFTKVEEEKNVAREKMEYFKRLKNEYRVPDVMEYVILQKEINEMNRNIKVWQRRKNIQEISLNATIREIKHLTGSTVTDPSWIQDPVGDDADYCVDFSSLL